VLDPRLRKIARAMEARPLGRVSRAGAPWEAAVALVVQPDPRGLDVLLIRRAEHPTDPWSGHMALPGGRRAAHDEDLVRTAVRETLEEVGLDLGATGTLLGALGEVSPRGSIGEGVVAPFVFSVPRGTELRPNHEVARTVWIPASSLYHPDAAATHVHPLPNGARVTLPAYRHEGEVIWGMTYRVLQQFLEFVGPALEEP
jgi:8-oxo-dGTP pyrophosphatase MutT (NUDIX family)